MSPEESRRLVAESSAEALRLSVSSIDLRNGGRARSEHVLDDLFFTLVGLADPALFVEAGAKDAPASLRVAEERPGTTVIACEANPRLQRHFAEALGHAERGVDYRATALSDAPGTVTLHVPEIGDDFGGGLAGTSSLLSSGPAESPFGPEVVRTEMQVEATTLDALGREVPQGRVALWVDVEGAAEQVLRGGRDLLARCDVLKIEVETQAYWQGQWVEGDLFAHLMERGLRPVARDLTGDAQYNVVFVDRDFLGREDVRRVLTAHAQRLHRRELPGPIGRLRRSTSARRLARQVLRRGR